MGPPNPSRETKFSGANEDKRIIHFPCSAADHEQDWQPCPVVRAIHTNIVLHTHTAVVKLIDYMCILYNSEPGTYQ